jgi:alpha/beta superfamily hydrolase
VAPAFRRLDHLLDGTNPAMVPESTLLIHGEKDDTVPLQDSLDWARDHDVPVMVIPGADHFFHQRLHLIRQIVGRWLPAYL